MLSRVAAASITLVALVHGAVVHIDPNTRYQTYDGTGCAEAFQRSLLLHELDTAHQQEALDYLFTEKGAGFTILRNGLGSSPTEPFDHMKSICPKKPASNNSEVSSKKLSLHFRLRCSSVIVLPPPNSNQSPFWNGC